MATLPRLQQFDVAQGIAIRDNARNRYLDDQKQSALQRIGQLAASGDMNAASGEAFRSGQLDIGARIRQMSQEEQARLVDDAASWAYSAQTPEAWEAGRQMWAEKGFDVGDFGTRDQLISRAMSVKEQMQMQMQRDNAARAQSNWQADHDMRREALDIRREAEQNDARPKPFKLTTVDRKAVLEADDAVNAGLSVIDSLDRAIQINDQALYGPSAQVRGYLGSLTGQPKAVATEELRNIVTSQALEQLKATFGAMPTEGERKILLEVQGSVNQAPEVRKKIFERAKALAERRVEQNRGVAEDIRSGTYYTPGRSGGGMDRGGNEVQDAIEQAQDAIKRGADPEMVRERLRQNGIDPGGI